MPPTHLSPTDAQILASVLRRVEALEFKLDRSKQATTLPVSSGLSLPLPCSFPGTNVTGSFSCPYEYKGPGVDFQQIIVKRRAAGAANETWEITINGGVLYSPTLLAGVVSATFAVPFSLTDADVLLIEITDAGDGQDTTVEFVPVVV